MKNAPGTLTGSLFGTLFLLGGIAMWIWAPDFNGFFDRGQSEPALPIWVVLFGLAALNYAYAGLSQMIQNRRGAPPDEDSDPDAPGGGQNC